MSETKQTDIQRRNKTIERNQHTVYIFQLSELIYIWTQRENKKFKPPNFWASHTNLNGIFGKPTELENSHSTAWKKSKLIILTEDPIMKEAIQASENNLEEVGKRLMLWP